MNTRSILWFYLIYCLAVSSAKTANITTGKKKKNLTTERCFPSGPEPSSLAKHGATDVANWRIEGRKKKKKRADAAVLRLFQDINSASKCDGRILSTAEIQRNVRRLIDR